MYPPVALNQYNGSTELINILYGEGGFNNQTGPILVHIYPIFNNNLHVKYRSNLISHVGPLHKIQGYQGYRNVCKCRPHHSGDIMYNKGKQFENQFFIYWPKCKKMYILLGYLGGPEGIFNDQTGPVLLSSYSLTDIYVHVKYRSNLIRNL